MTRNWLGNIMVFTLIAGFLSFLLGRAIFFTHYSFLTLPKGDDAWWTFYVMNHDYSSLFGSELAGRPRYFVNLLVLSFWRIWPNTDLPFLVLMDIAQILIIVMALVLAVQLSGPLGALITSVLLSDSFVLATIGHPRSVYLYSAWALGLGLTAVAGIQMGYSSRSQFRRQMIYIVALITIVFSATCRESMYFLGVGTVLFFASHLLEQRGWGRDLRRFIALLIFGIVASGIFLLIPFARNLIWGLISGKSKLLNVEFASHNWTFMPGLFHGLALSILINAIIRVFTIKTKLTYLFLVMILGLGALTYHSFSYSSSITGPFFFGIAVCGCCASWFVWRCKPFGILLFVFVMNLGMSIFIRGGIYYFFETGVLSAIIAGALFLNSLRLASDFPSLRVGIFLALFGLLPFVQENLKKQNLYRMWRVSERFEQASLVGDLQKVAHYSNREDWNFVLSPLMAEDYYNHMFYEYAVPGIIALRLGHSPTSKIPAYTMEDSVVPLPYGVIGRYCIVPETKSVRSGSGDFSAELSEGDILLGIKLDAADERNLYNRGKSVRNNEGMSSLARYVSIEPGRLYMVGVFIRASSDVQKAFLQVRPNPWGGLEWSFPVGLKKGEKTLSYSYVMPLSSHTFAFDPLPRENPSVLAEPIAAEVESPFVIDVTVFTKNEMLKKYSGYALGAEWAK